MSWFCLIAGALTLFAVPLEAVADDVALSIAGVQLHIDESMYESIESFSLVIEKELHQAISTSGDEVPPDLVIFPEYTSVFLALIPYSHQIMTSDTLSMALTAIRSTYSGIRSLKDLFIMQAGWVEGKMDLVWGGLAGRYGVAILAGTYFAAESGALRNRLVVYDKSGRRLYEQDKVYLTEFELDIIGLEPGSLDFATTFNIEGFHIAPTICRDTFFPAWNRVFSGADYWIDIKANGEEYSEDIAGKFFYALPERIEESGADGGMTVCLTGSFLDLFWEGRSFVVSYDRGKVGVNRWVDTVSYGALLRDTLWTGDTNEP